MLEQCCISCSLRGSRASALLTSIRLSLPLTFRAAFHLQGAGAGATQGGAPHHCQQQPPQQLAPLQPPPQQPQEQQQQQQQQGTQQPASQQQQQQRQLLEDLLPHELWAVIFRLTDAKARGSLFRVNREARTILMASTERLQITSTRDRDPRQLATQLLNALSLPGGAALKLSSLFLEARTNRDYDPAFSTFLWQLAQDARRGKLARVRQLKIISSVRLTWHSQTHTHTHTHTHTQHANTHLGLRQDLQHLIIGQEEEAREEQPGGSGGV